MEVFGEVEGDGEDRLVDAIGDVPKDARVPREVGEPGLDLDARLAGAARVVKGLHGLVLGPCEQGNAGRALVDDAASDAAVFPRHGAAGGAPPRREGDEVVLLPPPEAGELADRARRLVDARLPVVQREQVGHNDDLRLQLGVHADAEAQHGDELAVGEAREQLFDVFDLQVRLERRRDRVHKDGGAAAVGLARSQVPEAAARAGLEGADAERQREWAPGLFAAAAGRVPFAQLCELELDAPNCVRREHVFEATRRPAVGARLLGGGGRQWLGHWYGAALCERQAGEVGAAAEVARLRAQLVGDVGERRRDESICPRSASRGDAGDAAAVGEAQQLAAELRVGRLRFPQQHVEVGWCGRVSGSMADRPADVGADR